MALNNKSVAIVTLIALSGAAHADLYRLTFAGMLDSVVDTRTIGNDPFAGTAWGLDQYAASVGDAWEFSITYDSDTPAQDATSDFAIYGLSFPASISLNGNTLDHDYSTQMYFVGDSIEMFNEADGVQGSGFTWIGFERNDGLTDLINNGQLFTDSSDLENTVWQGLNIGLGGDGLFDLRASNTSGVSITVEQIPTPSTLLILGSTGLIAGRRRR
tara:strand:- start:72933 stop:73577 length:645 start_codon:yes stop_codon:yes gene_type:complete